MEDERQLKIKNCGGKFWVPKWILSDLTDRKEIKMQKIKMIDISKKLPTERTARASGKILLKESTINDIKKGKLIKGDVLTTAKIAGILASKKVDELVPLTHPLNITYCDLEFEIEKSAVRVTSLVKTKGSTGPDIEALTAVAIALLTIYDMIKSVDREAEITDICLLEKTGGKTGDFRREVVKS